MRPKGTQLKLAIAYRIAIALPDIGRSMRHVVCQREALPRTMLREPWEFGPHVRVKLCFYKDIIKIGALYPSAGPEVNQGLPVFILRVLLTSA